MIAHFAQPTSCGAHEQCWLLGKLLAISPHVVNHGPAFSCLAEGQ
jgi:hypothetical protein